MKIAEKTLAEMCREVVHVEVGLEEEREAHRIDALQQEKKVRRLVGLKFALKMWQNLDPLHNERLNDNGKISTKNKLYIIQYIYIYMSYIHILSYFLFVIN